MKAKLISGTELDALSRRVKGLYNWKAGVRAAIKRKFWKRQRQIAKKFGGEE